MGPVKGPVPNAKMYTFFPISMRKSNQRKTFFKSDNGSFSFINIAKQSKAWILLSLSRNVLNN